jgi:hypothetical protein
LKKEPKEKERIKDKEITKRVRAVTVISRSPKRKAGTITTQELHPNMPTTIPPNMPTTIPPNMPPTMPTTIPTNNTAAPTLFYNPNGMRQLCFSSRKHLWPHSTHRRTWN